MKTLITSLKFFCLFTLVTGVFYPLTVTAFVRIMFPGKADGSLVIEDNQVIGSKLIGQEFDSPGYFSSRPSAISYNPLPSGGSNFGLTNTNLLNQVDERRRQFILRNHCDTLTAVPSVMLFASASGLDPHISREAALLQAGRVARERGYNDAQKQKLIMCIDKLTEAPQFMILGEERVNVLMLNLETDRIK